MNSHETVFVGFFSFFFLWIIFSRIQSYKAVAWQRNLAKATAILEIYNIFVVHLEALISSFKLLQA